MSRGVEVVLENVDIIEPGDNPEFTADLIVDGDLLAHLESDGSEITFRWRVPASALDDFETYQAWVRYVEDQPPLEYNGSSYRKDEQTIILELLDAFQAG